MKMILVLINTVLVFILGASIWTAVSEPGGDELTVGKSKGKKKTVATTASPKVTKLQLKDAESAGQIICAKNIFDIQRCPGAVGIRGGSRGGTYLLVGIYNVNDQKGAIIMTKNTRPLRNSKGQVIPFKQFYRVGDTLSNGYTLSSVDNHQVVLSRGSSQMVLPLAQASENVTRSSGRQRTTNPMQQMVQLMQQSIGMQQRQQMNMMRMMRDNQRNSSTPARGSSTNRRGR